MILGLLAVIPAGIAAQPVFSSTQAMAISDSLRRELAHVHTPADSIPLMYNIFDLSEYNTRGPNAEELFWTAKRADNSAVQLDMLRHWANTLSNQCRPDELEMLVELAEELPDSEEKRQAITFIRSSIPTASKFTSEAERSDEIHRLLHEFNAGKFKDNDSDPYQRIEALFNLCYYLAGQTQGELLGKYLDELADELQALPPDRSNALYNKYLTIAAMTYSRSMKPEKAVQADRQLLKIIDKMQRRYQLTGRPYRSLDINKYVSLRRMARNYSALSKAEMQQVYDSIMALTRRNADIAEDDRYKPAAEAGYLMKLRRYEDAIPVLKKVAANSRNVFDRRFYLKELREAATETDDSVTLNNSAAAYADILEQYIDLKTAERLKELQMVYDLNEMKTRSTERELHSQRVLVTISLIVAAILCLTVIMLIRMVRRSRRLARELSDTNKRLTVESQTLMTAQQKLITARDKSRKDEREKEQLLNYISQQVLTPLNAVVEYSHMIVDNVQGENKKYLEHFCAVVSNNTFLLQNLVSDVQEIAQMENHKLRTSIMPSQVNVIGRLAVESIRPMVRQGVEITYTPSAKGDDDIAPMDPRRVEGILLNLLSNAAKFTDNGRIDLSCTIDHEADTLTYAVTDTGIGVPPDKTALIFERFEKLDPTTAGAGLGLTVARLVARTLGGDVRYDSTHTGVGARFLLVLPLNPQK